MSSRTLRVLLLVAALGVAFAGSYVIYGAERTLTATTTSAAAYAGQARAVVDDLHTLRAAQQAYVADGQGTDYWMQQAAERLARVDRGVADLAAAAASDASRAATQGAASALEKFRSLDLRARKYVESGQRLMASDVIFTDSLGALSSAMEHVETAAGTRQAESSAQVDELRSRQLYAGAGAVGFLLLLVLLLVPVPEAEVDVLTAMRALTDTAPLRPQPASAPASAPAAPARPPKEWLGDTESSARVISRMPAAPPPEPSISEAPAPPAPAAPAVAAPALPQIQLAPAPPAVDLPAAARVCAELARVLDAGDIPGLLSRAAEVLEAPGIIVWVADQQGAALFPLFAHGYPAQVLLRLGGLPTEASNATAAAWRTGQLLAVAGENGNAGALVSPIVTSSGCVGVLAAEVPSGREEREDVQALATIFAAQLATVVTPVAAADQQAAGGIG
jgi:GAF domain